MRKNKKIEEISMLGFRRDSYGSGRFLHILSPIAFPFAALQLARMPERPEKKNMKKGCDDHLNLVVHIEIQQQDNVHS
jgi:hypothetical protein